jgi:tRNA(His) guanylyltransferase
MQEREIFRNLIVTPPVMVRIDGRAFHGLSQALNLEKPFDRGFSDAMGALAARMVGESGLMPLFAYTFSDEMSLYFSHLPFNGRVEKIDSIAASFAASALTIDLGTTFPISFDSRIIPLHESLVSEYLEWRQNEAWRNHINAYCQHALMQEGMTAREAAAALKGKPSGELHEMMFTRGVNLAKTPAWQRRGVLAYREEVKKEGYNPLTGERVEAERYVVTIERDLPLFGSPEGAALLRSLLGGP